MSDSKYVTLSEENFASQVIEAERPVRVDFWAEWCAPCRAMAPIIDDLAQRFEGRATVAKVDVDAHPGLAERYGIRSIPALLFFADGKPVDEVIGRASQRALADKLDHLVSDA